MIELFKDDFFDQSKLTYDVNKYVIEEKNGSANMGINANILYNSRSLIFSLDETKFQLVQNKGCDYLVFLENVKKKSRDTSIVPIELKTSITGTNIIETYKQLSSGIKHAKFFIKYFRYTEKTSFENVYVVFKNDKLINYRLPTGTDSTNDPAHLWVSNRYYCHFIKKELKLTKVDINKMKYFNIQ